MTTEIGVVPKGAPLDSYLMRFVDGKARGDFTVKWPWPLPDRVVYFPETGAIVDFKGEPEGGFPTDLGLVHYEKFAESELPSSVDANPNVMRGAQYRERTP